MYKKFLWALYTGFILFNLNTVSQAGRYTEAFEDEVQNNKCRQLTCNIINSKKSHSYSSTITEQVEVGHSIGPSGGKTIYYKNKQIPLTHTYYTDHYRCSRCDYVMGSSRNWIFYPSVPKIKINQKGNIKEMTIEGSSDLPICGKPSLYGELEDIWKKAGLKFTGYLTDCKWHLESLLKAAKQLDSDESFEKLIESPPNNDILPEYNI